MAKPRALSPKKLDEVIAALWRVHGDRVQILMTDIPKIFAAAREAFVAAGCPRGEDAARAVMEPSILASVATYRRN